MQNCSRRDHRLAGSHWQGIGLLPEASAAAGELKPKPPESYTFQGLDLLLRTLWFAVLITGLR